MHIEPAEVNHGIVFERRDLPGRPAVRAKAGSVQPSSYRTLLVANGVEVSTVEHLLAAMLGLGLDNARVSLDSGEVPAMDGSALHFVEQIRAAQLTEQDAARPGMRLLRSVEVREADRWIRLEPGCGIEIDCRLSSSHPKLSGQHLDYRHSSDAFTRELAPARTYGLLADLDELHAAGLARGGGLENAVVFDDRSVINPGGLRFENECVRHKVLDILGDLALLEASLEARIWSNGSGHRMHHELVLRLASEPDLCMRF